MSAWLSHPDRTRAVLTEPGPDGRIGFATIDSRGRQSSPAWLAAAAGWTPCCWAADDVVVLWRRVDGHSELGLLRANGKLASDPVLGRPFAADGDELLVAVNGPDGTILCRHQAGTDDYQVLDATAGVRSVAGWDPRSGRLVVTTTESTVRVVAYDSDGCAELPVDWPPGVRPVHAVGHGRLLGLTGADDDGATVPGVLDLPTLAVRWFPEHAGWSCTDIAAGGTALLLADWRDHAYRYRATTVDGHVIGAVAPVNGLATDLRFAVDQTHVFGRFQSPARKPVITSWDLRTGAAQSSTSANGNGMRWRHREIDGVPEWLFEPQRDAHGGVVVYLHGGPRSRLNQVHEPVIATLVAAGWTVIGMNYPGSTGYGDAYGDVTIGDWGGADVAAVTARIRALRADMSPVCLYGISYGGYLALLAAADADAVAVWAPVTDLALLVESTTGVRRQWLAGELAGMLAAPRLLAERSPAAHPTRLRRVPLLVGHAVGDDRVPVAQSRRLVDVLATTPTLRYLEDGWGTHAPSNWQWWADSVATHLRSATTSQVGKQAS